MKILSLKLRGFIGIRDGLGLEEIDIDLSQFYGLVALDGPNGMGKTTVLENLQPFRQMVSRDGSLKHHVYLRDSVKEFTFLFAGNKYRTLIKIDAESDRTEAFIYKNDAEGSEVNGKVSEYDKYIKKLVGSPELFFNSIFAAQNCEKISDLTTGDFQNLLAEFLRLHIYKAWETTCKACVSIINEQLEALELDIDKIKEKLSEKDEVERSINGKQMIVLTNTELIESGKKSLKILEASRENLKEKKAKASGILERIQDLEKSKDRIEQDIKQDEAELGKDLSEMRAEAQSLTSEIKQLDELLADEERISGADQRLKQIDADLEKMTAAQSKFNSEVQELTKLQLEKQTEANEIDKDANEKKAETEKQLQIILNKVAGKTQKIDNLKKTIDDLEKDSTLRNLEKDLEVFKNQVKDLDLRDPDCKSSTCSFITTALKAKESIPEVEKMVESRKAETGKELNEYRKEIDAISLEIPALEKERDELQELYKKISDEAEEAIKPLHEKIDQAARDIHLKNNTLQGIVLSIDELKDEKKMISELAAKAPEIEIAKAKKKDLEQKKEENFAAGIKLRDKVANKIEGKKAQLTEINTQLSPLKRDLEAAGEFDQRISQISADIDAKSERIRELEKDIATTKAHIETIEKELKKFDELELELKAEKSKKKQLTEELSDWHYLRQACSKDGIRALEIDSAAPSITGFANDLMHDNFGQNRSVSLRTMDPESGKETLDVMVIEEDGKEAPLDMKSGGEQIPILKALQLGMTLLSAEKNDKEFNTSLSDEADGALDPVNGVKFIGLTRSFMKIGGFDTCFYITHKPDCASMADQKLVFEKGGVTIQ